MEEKKNNNKNEENKQEKGVLPGQQRLDLQHAGQQKLDI